MRCVVLIGYFARKSNLGHNDITKGRGGDGNRTPEGAPDKRREYRNSEKFGEWEVCEVETGTTVVCQGKARADAISMARGLADQ